MAPATPAHPTPPSEPPTPALEPYAQLLACRPLACAEPDLPDEAHLQALWQDARFRPAALALPDGTPIELLEVGRWNTGPGPDFQDATLLMNGLVRRGDVELHCRPADWDLHGHSGDPAYAQVILHVTWLETPPAKTLPPGIRTLPLKPLCTCTGPFDFSRLDLSAMPYPPPADTAKHPCLTHFAQTPGALDALLASAGRYRLSLKARLLADALRVDPPEQVLYAGLLRAVGYGRNAELFCRLAKELPYARLRPFPPLQRFAILAHTAGLLPTDRRDLWDLWWQSALPPPLEPYPWDFRAMRPQNHPRTRLAGAIGILHTLDALLARPISTLPAALTEASGLLLKPLALPRLPVGIDRAHAIVTNLLIPYRIATGQLALDALPDLPGETVSMPMRDVWHRLCGSLRGLPKEGLRQQGLLQLYADFCHNPAIRCATCPIGR